MTPAEKGKLTRHRNAEFIEARREERKEREQLIIAAMRRVLGDPQSSPTELIEAAKLLSSLN